MYNGYGCNACSGARFGGGFSWIIWIVVILFVIGLFDGNGCGCDNDTSYNRNNGCGCGCN